MDYPNLERPPELTDLGNEVYELVLEFLELYDATHSGGCKVFYSPKEWRQRGELYGLNSELIVVYDGGDHRPYFALDVGNSLAHEMLSTYLYSHRYYMEACTHWYSAIYKE